MDEDGCRRLVIAMLRQYVRDGKPEYARKAMIKYARLLLSSGQNYDSVHACDMKEVHDEKDQ
jgi:hypothetical protein